MPLDDVAVTPLDPTRFRDVLSPQGSAQFEHAIARGRELLDGQTLWNVNSTAHGGGVGVAECCARSSATCAASAPTRDG